MWLGVGLGHILGWKEPEIGSWGWKRCVFFLSMVAWFPVRAIFSLCIYNKIVACRQTAGVSVFPSNSRSVLYCCVIQLTWVHFRRSSNLQSLSYDEWHLQWISTDNLLQCYSTWLCLFYIRSHTMRILTFCPSYLFSVAVLKALCILFNNVVNLWLDGR